MSLAPVLGQMKPLLYATDERRKIKIWRYFPPFEHLHTSIKLSSKDLTILQEDTYQDMKR
jgi:hypothetical protein